MHGKRESGMLEGKFSNCQVDEVLQTVAQGTGTGRLSIEGTSVFGGRVQATFFLEGARIVHADAMPGTPFHVLVDLFSLREGNFAFAAGETSTIRDQSVTVADVVLQVTAALDEWNAIRQQIDSIDAVFALKPDGSTNMLSLTSEQWQIMARLDGKASIREVGNATGKAVITVAKMVNEFVQAGLAVEVQRAVAEESSERVQPQRRSLFGLWTRK
jgi:hypothetical protein